VNRQPSQLSGKGEHQIADNCGRDTFANLEQEPNQLCTPHRAQFTFQHALAAMRRECCGHAAQQKGMLLPADYDEPTNSSQDSISALGRRWTFRAARHVNSYLDISPPSDSVPQISPDDSTHCTGTDCAPMQHVGWRSRTVGVTDGSHEGRLQNQQQQAELDSCCPLSCKLQKGGSSDKENDMCCKQATCLSNSVPEQVGMSSLGSSLR
jgi:hypothetical protein